MVGNALKSGKYVKSGDEYEFIGRSRQTYSKHKSVAVLIDFKHKMILAHGESSVVRECYKRLQKSCDIYKIPHEFAKYVLVLEKADWDVNILNEIAKNRNSIPVSLLRRYAPKHAVKKLRRVPVIEMTNCELPLLSVNQQTVEVSFNWIA